jgi:hypothetical protein
MSTRARSVWAVVAGILFIIIVTTLVDVALHVAGVFPPMGEPMSDALAALATAYRVPITIAGAWLTARIAPGSAMRHALILGWVGVGLALAGLALTWNAGLGPRWYPMALVVLSLPQCWIGGWLQTRRARE